MFSINGSEFVQWQQGKTLTNANMAKGDAVQFYSGSGEASIMYAKEENGTVVVEVPNRMLQFAANITARLVKGGGVTSFAVQAADKPKGYVFKDNEYRETLPEHLRFGGETEVGGDTLTWDGNTEGLEVVNDFGVPLYHVSDLTPSETEIANGLSLSIFINGGETDPDETITVNDAQVTSQDGFIAIQANIGTDLFPVVIISPSDNLDLGGIVIPKKGIYVLGTEVFQLTSLTINGYTGFTTKTVKTLEEKYLPPVDWEDVQNKPFEMVGSDTLTWDGNTEGLVVNGAFCRVSDVVITAEDLANGYTIGITNNEGVVSNFDNLDLPFGDANGALVFDEFLMICVSQDGWSFEGMTFKSGVYALNIPNGGYLSSVTINGFNGFNVQEKIKPEYLPNNIGGGGFRINVTMDDADNYVSDKTYAEITEAIGKGLIPYVVYGEYILQWHMSVGMSEIATFAGLANGHHFNHIDEYNYMNIEINEYECVNFNALDINLVNA